MISVACVRTGTKYPAEYVERLRDAVARHLPAPHRFFCVTDRPRDLNGIETADARGLVSWWAKMTLFDPVTRGAGRCLYFDLDTVVCGDLSPLSEWDGRFGICDNFTRRSGHSTWPCRYGSAVMSFGDGFGSAIWQAFDAQRRHFIAKAGRYGDQIVVEWLKPDATLLQDELPAGYFIGWRDIGNEKPDGAAVVCFGGSKRPHNSAALWVREHWR